MAATNTERTVLVAVDASPNARNAFDYGLNIPVEEWKNVLEEQMSKVQKLEKDYEADLLSKRASYKMNCSEQDKNPGQAIIRLAEAEHADMIVMGTRGLDALRRTLLGSVSDYVVRHSSVPVVICPLPKK